MKKNHIGQLILSSILLLLNLLIISCQGKEEKSNLQPEAPQTIAAEESLSPDEDLYDDGVQSSAQTAGPNTKISKLVRPAPLTGSTTATFKFKCTTPPCTFKCKLDTSRWKRCKSLKTYTGLTDGLHTFKVRATDSAGQTDRTPAKYSWTVETTPPETTIDSNPAILTNSTSASFTFSCTDAHTPCTFECQLDTGGWGSCSSPKSYSSLSEGSHTFYVRATDAAQNADLTPASYSWTIDITRPDTIIDNNPASLTNSTSATFTFHCTDAHTPCTFECQLDGGGWNACSSPKVYSGLSEGSHTFYVRATDAAQNADLTPASYNWTIDTTPPDTTITYHPSNPSNSNSATFEFTCNEGTCTFECNFDSAGWFWCSSPENYFGLSESSHTFQVRAMDSVGNTDLSPASYTWTVDTPPDTYVTLGPSNPTQSNSASFTFDCIGGPCTFECQIDSGSWSACSSPRDYSGLAEGVHTFKVRATDLSSLTDPTPASYPWTIDRTPPETYIDSTPPNPSSSPYANFQFSCSEPSCSFECQLDAGGFNVCASPKTYTVLPGSHIFQVRAIDQAGNPDTSPAPYSWNISLSDYWMLSGIPDGRLNHTALWTGTDMIIWGGEFYDAPYAMWRGYNTGGRYDPATDSWTATTTANAPSARWSHTAVWTGSEMIIWGGSDGSKLLNTGGRYNPATDSWTATTTANAPSARGSHTAVWTGNQMIVWGGGNNIGYFADGGRYNPATDSWTATTTANAPSARGVHTAVWTGTEMIVWGGYGGYYLHTGGRYDPATDSWTATTTANAPSARCFHTAVWTGSEMIIWGGDNGSNLLNTGGRYNPATDSWTATATTNAPYGRKYHTAVWTGTKMIVWGGFGGYFKLNTGGRYNPATDSWTATTTANAPSARPNHTAVWTGSEMIVWGGGDMYDWLNTGGRYNPATDSWIKIPFSYIPSGRDTWNSVVWTGSEMIIWGGEDANSNYLNTGGRYDPVTDSWIATATDYAPSGRVMPTAVWTGSEMIVWGGYNYDGSHHFLNTGGRYNPATDSWTATSTANAPSGRWLHTAVWTGSEMIVWGGYYWNGSYDEYFSTGGRYNPTYNSWTATSTNNAPLSRARHTAIWTGSEMIVWGGGHPDASGYYYLDTGGRYNPVTNSWTATATTNAPYGRQDHTAVWTGNQMIVWGGGNNIGYFADGGRYNPTYNSWTATAYSNAPYARGVHTAVWTGTEMIVWGGYGGAGYCNHLNTGGKYNPTTNSWAPTTITTAPSARRAHNAVWTGEMMIIWGGNNDLSYLNNGGRYWP